MQRLSRLVAATSVAALTCLPAAGVALAQSAPNTGAGTTTAAPSTTAAETAPAAEKGKAATKKKKPAKMTRQQEIDRSIDQGTVPARYRSSVPKEYQQYVPFDKR